MLLGAALGAVLMTAVGVGAAVARQSGSHDRSWEVAAEAKASKGKAKYVIFLLGDGMGQSEITIARNYQYGAGGRLPGIDTPPLTGDITTYAVDEAARRCRTTSPTPLPPARAGRPARRRRTGASRRRR